MVFYAIQWGLVVSCVLSSITGISGVANPSMTLERFFGPNYPSAPTFLWNFRMQFLSLLVVYSLNLIVAFYIPLPLLAYLLASGNMIRVAYITVNYLIKPEKIALMGFQEDGKMLKVICGIQTVLAVVIASCAYASSKNAEFAAYAAELATTGAEADFGPYVYFVYVFCGIGILGRLPQIADPVSGMARFMNNGEADLPSDKGEMTMLEFAFGFTAVNFAMIWSFLLVILYYIPTVSPIACFLTAIGVIFMGLMAATIVDIAALKFAIKPMLFFVCLISFMTGASVLQLVL